MSAAGLWTKLTDDVKATIAGMVGMRRVTGLLDDGRVRTVSLGPDAGGESRLVVMRGAGVEIGDDVLTLKLFGRDVVLGALGGDVPRVGPLVPIIDRRTVSQGTTNVGTLVYYQNLNIFFDEPGTYRIIVNATGVMSRSANSGGMRFQLNATAYSNPELSTATSTHDIDPSVLNIASRTQMAASLSIDAVITVESLVTNTQISLAFTGLDTAATTTMSYAFISGFYQKIA